MWGSSTTINHSWCCCARNSKLTCPSNVLNLWSKSHIDSCGNYLISFSLVMHCDSNLGFLNSFFNSSLISLMVCGCCALVENFINHVRALSLNVVVKCTLLMSSLCTWLMFHIASQRKKWRSGSSTLVPQKIGSFISSPILLLCKRGLCCALDKLVYCSSTLGGLVWPWVGIYGVLTRPPWLLPAEVFYSGGEVVCVLLSSKSAGDCLRPSLNLSGVSSVCLTQDYSVSSIFPINLFPAYVRLGSSCIPFNTYRSDLGFKMPLSHNSILIHKFKEFKNLPWYPLKNWHSSFLYAFTMSTTNSMMNPDNKLVSQKSNPLETSLSIFFNLYTASWFHSVGWSLCMCPLQFANLASHECNSDGNIGKKLREHLCKYIYVTMLHCPN